MSLKKQIGWSTLLTIVLLLISLFISRNTGNSGPDFGQVTSGFPTGFLRELITISGAQFDFILGGFIIDLLFWGAISFAIVRFFNRKNK